MKIAVRVFAAIVLMGPTVHGRFVTPAAKAERLVAQDPEEDVKKLVVMITSRFSEETTVSGAGIIAGVENDRLYIATAAHNVVKETLQAREVRVQFRWLARTFTASILRHVGQPLDLAVLSVTGVKELGTAVTALPFERLGNPGALQRGDDVYSLGNPRQGQWIVNVTPDKFSTVANDSLLFESNFVSPGFSGGALLDERWQLVGMIVEDQPPLGKATKITRILGTLKEWRVPVNLRTPSPYVTVGNNYSCRVPPEGLIQCWSDEVETAAPDDPRFGVVSVGAHICGITFNGEAYCTGRGESGQLGNGLMTDQDQFVLVQGKLSFASVSAGTWHTCGVTKRGQAYCWGSGVYGKLGNDSSRDSPVPLRVSGNLVFRSVSVGHWHACGVTIDRLAYCWGAIALLDEFGTSFEKGPRDDYPPTPVTGGLRFDVISAGQFFTCGVTTERRAYCWGANGAGQLGNGSVKESRAPVAVVGGLPFRTVSAGLGAHACGITSTGAAYCWGLNGQGQLGNGTGKDSNVPVRVSGGLAFTSISAGFFHTCGVTTDASTYCWGGVNVNGSGTGTKAGSSVPVRVPGLP